MRITTYIGQTQFGYHCKVSTRSYNLVETKVYYTDCYLTHEINPDIALINNLSYDEAQASSLHVELGLAAINFFGIDYKLGHKCLLNQSKLASG